MHPGTAVARAGATTDATAVMAAEVRESLSARVPWLASKYFYDDRGSALFEEITRLPEYYPTRTEIGILERVADEIAERTRPREVAEIGSGSGRKIRLILDAASRAGRLERCALFDIHRGSLDDSVTRLSAAYPRVAFRGVEGDFLVDLAALGPGHDRLLLFLAGTVGNLHPDDEVPGFLRAAGNALGDGDRLLMGVDLEKDVARLEAAYDDSQGVTARFNLNILKVVNDRLGADFDLSAFRHVAFYDRERHWIEMRVRAVRPSQVEIPAAGISLKYSVGDEIRTEISCKYTRASLEGRLAGTGLSVECWYTDPESLFASALIRKSAAPAMT